MRTTQSSPQIHTQIRRNMRGGEPQPDARHPADVDDARGTHIALQRKTFKLPNHRIITRSPFASDCKLPLSWCTILPEAVNGVAVIFFPACRPRSAIVRFEREPNDRQLSSALPHFDGVGLVHCHGSMVMHARRVKEPAHPPLVLLSLCTLGSKHVEIQKRSPCSHCLQPMKQFGHRARGLCRTKTPRIPRSLLSDCP